MTTTATADRLALAMAARGYRVPPYVVLQAMFDAGIHAEINPVNVAVHDHLCAHAAMELDR